MVNGSLTLMVNDPWVQADGAQGSWKNKNIFTELFGKCQRNISYKKWLLRMKK